MGAIVPRPFSPLNSPFSKKMKRCQVTEICQTILTALAAYAVPHPLKLFAKPLYIQIASLTATSHLTSRF